MSIIWVGTAIVIFLGILLWVLNDEEGNPNSQKPKQIPKNDPKKADSGSIYHYIRKSIYPLIQLDRKSKETKNEKQILNLYIIKRPITEEEKLQMIPVNSEELEFGKNMFLVQINKEDEGGDKEMEKLVSEFNLDKAVDFCESKVIPFRSENVIRSMKLTFNFQKVLLFE